MAAFEGNKQVEQPPCLHPHLIAVDPSVHSRGVGRILVDWGKELAVAEKLPLYLESNLEATGFYEKIGFARLSEDVVVGADGQKPMRIPLYAWEGEQREGHWLERIGNQDESEGRWRWKDDKMTK